MPKTKREVNLKVNLDIDDLMQKLLNHELNNPLKLQFKRVNLAVDPPYYATTRAACFDLHAALKGNEYIVSYDSKNEKHHNKVHEYDNNAHVIIEPGTRALIPSGYVFGIPDGYSLRLHPRSGTALKYGAALANSQGIIDLDFAEESHFMVHNISTVPLTIKHNERVGQGELVPVNQVELEEVDELRVVESNRKGGLGSTGK